ITFRSVLAQYVRVVIDEYSTRTGTAALELAEIEVYQDEGPLPDPEAFDDRASTKPPKVTRALSAWEFDSTGDAEGWVAANQVTPFTVSGGQLRFSSTGGDPYVIGPQVSFGAGPLRVEVVMTSSVSGGGQVFWGTTAGGFAEARSARFPVQAGTATYTVTIPASDGELRQLRLDPVSGTGDFAVDAVRVLR
ncbi:MAG TPA: hypothetical protein VFE45_12620, partial [Coriobacteriia bacterium]|nr:hypothetical protein [Coriobacteriia bacterium]